MAQLEERCEKKLDKEFICFIESKRIEHAAEINVLLKCNESGENQYQIQTFKFENPFEYRDNNPFESLQDPIT